MATKRVARSALDWSKFAEVLPKDSAAESTYKTLKGVSDTWTSKVAALPENLSDLDWGYYKKRLPAYANTVTDFEQKFKALKVDYPKQPTELFANMEKMEKEYKVNLDKLKVEVEERKKAIKNDLRRIEAMPPMDQMTPQDWLDLFPEFTYDPRVRPCTLMPFGDLVDQPVEETIQNRQYGIPDDLAGGH